MSGIMNQHYQRKIRFLSVSNYDLQTSVHINL